MKTVKKILFWLVIFLLFISLSSFSRLGTNPSSRFILTKALTNGQLAIEKNDIDFYSGLDYAVKDGKYYSDKPPGISFIILPFYFLGDFSYKNGILFPSADSFNYMGDANAFLLIIIFVTTLNAFGVLRFYDTLILLKCKKRTALLLAFIFGFGTLFLVFSSSLFSHSIVASFLIFSIYHLIKSRENSKHLLLSGIFLSIVILSEYLVLLFLPAFLIYLLLQKSIIRGLLLFFSPIVIFLILLGMYNWLAFGSPLNYSYQFSTFKDTQNFNHDLIDGVYNLLISTWRGLFFYNPILILGILGSIIFFRKNRNEAILFILIILIQIIVISKYSYFHGGLTYGPRHLVLTIPFFMFLASPLFKKKFLKDKFKAIAYVSVLLILISISIFHSFLGAFVNQTPAPEDNKNPIYQIVLPQFLHEISYSFLARNYQILFGGMILISFIGVIYLLKVV